MTNTDVKTSIEKRNLQVKPKEKITKEKKEFLLANEEVLNKIVKKLKKAFENL